jgi:hypothetical protein
MKVAVYIDGFEFQTRFNNVEEAMLGIAGRESTWAYENNEWNWISPVSGKRYTVKQL